MNSPLYDLVLFSSLINGVPRNSISGYNLLLNLSSNRYSPDRLGEVDSTDHVTKAKNSASVSWVRYSKLPGLEDVRNAVVPELDYAMSPLLHTYSQVEAVLKLRREKGRVGLFLIEHEAELRAHLGAPVSCADGPSYLSLLDNRCPHPSGLITATAKSWETFHAVMSLIEVCTGSEFSKVRTHQNPPPKQPNTSAESVTSVRTDYQCRFAGKAHSECSTRRGALPANFRMKSAKSEKCGCTASISVWEDSGPKPLRLELYLTHTGHVPGSDNDKTSLPMHQRLEDFIVTLVEDGIHPGSHKAMLRRRGTDLCMELGIVPDPLNTMFFPKADPVRAVMHRAVLKKRQHGTDQVSVKIKMDKRPRGESSFFRPGTDTIPMLLVHQTPFMRRMLALFGNGIVGMDATHKITKWGFPLFILCVVTNHGFAVPVAIFFVDSESTELIAEALQVLKGFNPDWNPAYFMVDKSDAEKAAIYMAFPWALVLLCDFHRYQAWNRWLINRDHGVPASIRNIVYGMMVDIGNSNSAEQLERRIARFETHDLVKDNERLLFYFRGEWLSCAHMWVAYYRVAFHGGINTNNHQEAMNRVWKLWLEGITDGRLDSFLDVYFRVITVYYEEKYALKTIQSIRDHKMTRREVWPLWTAGLTTTVVELLLLRLKRASTMGGNVKFLGDSRYMVEKSEGTLLVMLHEDLRDQHARVIPNMTLEAFKLILNPAERCYVIDITEGSCTCPDIRANRLVCKHMFFIFRKTAEKYEHLPASLTKTQRTLIDASNPVVAAAQTSTEEQLEQLFVERLEATQQLTGQNPADDTDMGLDNALLLAFEIGSNYRAPRAAHPITNKSKNAILDNINLLRSAIHNAAASSSTLLANWVSFKDAMASMMISAAPLLQQTPWRQESSTTSTLAVLPQVATHASESLPSTTNPNSSTTLPGQATPLQRATPSPSLTLTHSATDIIPGITLATAEGSGPLQQSVTEQASLSMVEFSKKRSSGRPAIVNKRSIPDAKLLLATATATAAAELIARAAMPSTPHTEPSSPPSHSQQAIEWDMTVEGSNFSPNTRTGKISSGMRSAADAFTGNKPNTGMEATHPDVVIQHSLWVSLASVTPPQIAALLQSPDLLHSIASAQRAVMPREHVAAVAQYAPQRTPLWLAVRTGVVTGSIMGEILGVGFGGDTRIRAYKQVIPNMQPPSQRVAPADELVDIRLAWGREHESNGLEFLLKKAGDIRGLITHTGAVMQACETGLNIINPLSFSAAVTDGLEISQLPTMGSSPDVELRWVLGDKYVDRVAGEIKAPCPFSLNHGQRDGLYSFNPDVVKLSLTSVQYVQCQAHMLALPGVKRCVFVSHGPERVKVFIVPLNEVWCNLMMKQLVQINKLFIIPQLFPLSTTWQQVNGHKEFKAATVKACSGLSAQELSSCKGPDGRRFLL